MSPYFMSNSRMFLTHRYMKCILQQFFLSLVGFCKRYSTRGSTAIRLSFAAKLCTVSSRLRRDQRRFVTAPEFHGVHMTCAHATCPHQACNRSTSVSFAVAMTPAASVTSRQQHSVTLWSLSRQTRPKKDSVSNFASGPYLEVIIIDLCTIINRTCATV